ncbi:MAG: DUF1320 domain-containing protein [Candidatus Kapaibacterium sp.]|jgi:phage gp36-like protein|nr:DUF1320 domain-containing protein [Candidatus Kapabacteria bacterium]
MSYSSAQDIIDLFGEDVLAKLTKSPQADEEKIADAVEYADSIINTALQGRVNLPEEYVPKIISVISARLAYISLCESYYHLSDIPNTALRLKRDCMKLLYDLADGRINLIGNKYSNVIITRIKRIGDNHEYP